MTRADVNRIVLGFIKEEWASMCSKGLIVPSHEEELAKTLKALRRPGLYSTVGLVRPGPLREILTDLLNEALPNEDMVEILLISGQRRRNSECESSINHGLVFRSYGGIIDYISWKGLCEGLPASLLKQTVTNYTE